MAAPHTFESIAAALSEDDKVKLAGVDVDGIHRGKLISKKKFLSIAESGFGFCSVVFGWDMHDKSYFRELGISNSANGYRDLLAKVDLQSFRRIPWEDSTAFADPKDQRGVPFFLVTFHDPDTKEPIAPCPRGLLSGAVKKVREKGWSAMAGAEYEFFNFREDPHSLDANKGSTLEHMTPGMFGYSLTRPVQNQDFYYEIFNACKKFRVDIEGWHTETGPGVYEAALEFGEVKEMADRAGLFKYVVKSLGSKYGITPCFMAKPKEGLPGNSGHMHVSLVDSNGNNLFARPERDPEAGRDLAYLSDIGRHFLAGVLEGLPSVMPLLAPTVNSYKRLVENYWAPVTVSWGLEHRAASVRLISPPLASPEATRFEIRTCGADANPYYVLAAVLTTGLRGVERKLEIPVPPLGVGEGTGGGERLARNLMEAVNKMTARGSVAREVFGDAFVDHYAGTREHEWRLWEEAVTDWEIRRYIEMV
ncbi:glutamine synthetase/guanido kinase [Tuber magnatum]|uniref:Glutamine synthetase n=1 Tax=Tuber magnatum TaxID=42249 RepID=A0A317SJL3_9PEZI|nr:glutamine synthetase/guanido kinase [Tuber magnatum]